MPVYQYKGYRNDGGAATGIIDAESPKIARVKLRKVGVFPTDMVEQGSATAGSTAGISGRPSAGIGRSPALSTTDVAMMTRQLATLLVAGLPLVDAIGVMVDQTEKKSVKGLMADIREQIRGGASYSSVLESHPREFSQIYVHMVRAGEASGALDQILFRLAEFLEKQLALKHKVTNAVLYPALMMIVGISVLFFLMTFVVPKITAVFTSLKQALPWPTVVLMSVSHFLADYWPVILGGVTLTVWAVRRAMKTEAGQLTADRWLLKVPLIGEVSRMVAISRLTSTLATMLASGVQLLDAMEVAKRVMSNRVLEHAVEGARQNIREGETIAEPLKRSGEFPALVTHMIAVGEKSGEMEEMLRRIGNIYDGEVDRVITRFTSLLEPIMILVMGVL
ncbi:MAG: type II secretion system inner membrane protein GspF, partial [Nitrospiraceae bacterium]